MSTPLAGALAALTVPLPPGRTVTGEDDARRPLLWVGDGPAPIGLWERLHRAHPATGLWPLLLSPLREGDEDFRPWHTGELRPGRDADPGAHDPQTLLRTWWQGIQPDEDEDEEEAAQALAPYGPAWPAPAPAPAAVPDAAAADAAAYDLAAALEAVRPVRLGLVAATGGAHALAACGWTGPVNHHTTGEVAAVLADWEHRYGARLVEAGFDTLELSVPHPPATPEQALPLAAQFAALCPDQLFQGAGTLTELAGQLAGARRWTLWWD
ncbi:DUF4253 domain-containing protein [Kitasatospora sp. NPDC051170]|uniref:DUF4253 domain-containing protein n=1 Tax=Kitasatospora sp. NPDC051170 TaxID=3364056 RepID=UPI0037ACDBB7